MALSSNDRQHLRTQQARIEAADDRQDWSASDDALIDLIADAEDPKAMAAEWRRRTNQRPF
ncbi:hypothetical protein ACWD33_26220 [Streptomyces xiamenensis]